MKNIIIFFLMLQGQLLGFSQYPGCNVNDSLALVEFYYATNGQNWTTNTNWLTGTVNSWYGVFLSPDTTIGSPFRVTSIALNNNNLTGTISPLLCQLDELQVLMLMNNNTSGTIPECILHLSHLGAVYLDNNNLSGQLPSFSHCPLFDLRISNNEFSGPIPDSLVNNQLLNHFFINNNHFSSLPPQDTSIIIVNGIYNLSNNQFTFKDVLPYVSNYINCTYSPQDSVLIAYDTTIAQGSSIILGSWVDTCQANMYRWIKNGVFLTPNPVTSYQFVKNNVQFADSGYYTCNITNLNANNLVLHRRIVHVHISDTVTQVLNHLNPGYIIQYNMVDKLLKINIDLITGQYIRCYLYNMRGQQVLRLYQGKVQRQDLQYYLSSLNIKSGVYFVSLQSEDINLVKKIILP